MKSLLLIFMLVPLLTLAHGGEDHGSSGKSHLPITNYFSAEATSDKYEILLKYAPVKANDIAVMKLFISNVNTNEAVSPTSIKVTIPGLENKIEISNPEKGVYQLQTRFPEERKYTMNVAIDAPSGPDLLQLPIIEVGKELFENANRSSFLSDWKPLLTGFIIGGVVVLLGVLIFIRRVNKYTVTIITILVLIPAMNSEVVAHSGEDRGSIASHKVSSSLSFLVEKESQFLFEFTTMKIGSSQFNESIEFPGVIVPSPQGYTVLQIPQTGTIRSLDVTPGQHVRAGQVLAVVEQQLDAANEIELASRKSSAEAELRAAKEQYENIKRIEDIAAKKEVSEARARYESATDNARIFREGAGREGKRKLIQITAPITGIIGPFTLSMGSTVMAGTTLFEITDLDKIYVEAQVFPEQIMRLSRASQFTARSSVVDQSLVLPLQLISNIQILNSTNQTQKVLFKLENPEKTLKIGEQMTINTQTANQISSIVVPNEAITEVGGKPAVFIKDKAEQFRLCYIGTGDRNSSQTVVTKGIEEGERLLIQNVYELKMIYLNQ